MPKNGPTKKIPETVPGKTPGPAVRLVAPNVTGDYQGTLALQKPPAVPGPAVRLATGVGPPDAFAKGMVRPADPSVRLAFANCTNKEAISTGAVAKGLSPPEVRLAVTGNSDKHREGKTTDKALGSPGDGEVADPSQLPALLVSFYYLPQFQENRKRYHYRDWVMDSGAFSAHNSGVSIDLEAYIDCCLELMASDPTLTEVYSLDVIGDWKGSLKNTERMWARGVPAIPCYHAGEPWPVLIGMAKDYPKIALGGVALAKARKKDEWAKQCFARIWPKKVHGFAFGSEKSIMSIPFHSVDATNWELGPCRYGQWRAFGGQRLSVRGSQQNLRAEVEWYLDLERRARLRWKKEMALLESLDESPGPTVRLAEGGEGGRESQKAHAFSPTTVRLAETASGKTGAKARAFASLAADPVKPPAVRLVAASAVKGVKESGLGPKKKR